MDEQVSEQVEDGPMTHGPTGDATAADAWDDDAAVSTGDAAVDEALSRLVDLADQPLRTHVAVFDAVHGALQDRLADAEG